MHEDSLGDCARASRGMWMVYLSALNDVISRFQSRLRETYFVRLKARFCPIVIVPETMPGFGDGFSGTVRWDHRPCRRLTSQQVVAVRYSIVMSREVDQPIGWYERTVFARLRGDQDEVAAISSDICHVGIR